ncbi:histidine utilization repressor [Acetobacteraceae bacterium H6797]|nr:histidine utilization repressor [Acetobacteraceae bacterium H6797]
MRPALSAATPRYQQVKAFILSRVATGEFGAEDRIPSENELVKLCGVSRVTVNRALRELADAGLLKRVQGVGTFIAESKPPSALLEFRDIADEIRERGNRHEARVHLLTSIRADAELARTFGLPPGAELFRAELTHLENGVPVQHEARCVNPTVFPDFLAQDFSRTTPYRHLTSSAPLERVEHVVEAALPEAEVASRLDIAMGEPCLVVHRRTWSWGVVATRAWLSHPGSRFRLGSSLD